MGKTRKLQVENHKLTVQIDGLNKDLEDLALKFEQQKVELENLQKENKKLESKIQTLKRTKKKKSSKKTAKKSKKTTKK